jgi:glutathionylspermidine synthase
MTQAYRTPYDVFAIDMIEDRLSRAADELHTLLTRKITKHVLSDRQLAAVRIAKETISGIIVE